MIPLGSQLKARRLELGLSRVQAAALADMNTDHLRKIEHGEVVLPQWRTLLRLLVVLDCEITVKVTGRQHV